MRAGPFSSPSISQVSVLISIQHCSFLTIKKYPSAPVWKPANLSHAAWALANPLPPATPGQTLKTTRTPRWLWGSGFNS
ncbi:hypothetical protein CapIbe_022288 [Capra ibex]